MARSHWPEVADTQFSAGGPGGTSPRPGRRLARWPALGGRYIITIIAAHAVLITWGCAVTFHQRVTTEAGTLLTSYPDVLMATVAAGLLLGVGLVSARLVRRRLAYESTANRHRARTLTSVRPADITMKSRTPSSGNGADAGYHAPLR